MNTKSKLLLVDDETAITDRLAPFLTRAGFDVKVAVDGETALREIDSFLPDLVLLDVLMPKWMVERCFVSCVKKEIGPR